MYYRSWDSIFILSKYFLGLFKGHKILCFSSVHLGQTVTDARKSTTLESKIQASKSDEIHDFVVNRLFYIKTVIHF
jgi:hypothetical protein